MKKIILAVVLSLSLTACASIKNPFDKPTLAAVESGYGAALSLAVGYRDACAKRQIPPSCRPIVAELQFYGRKAQAAVVSARNFARNNPTLDITSALLAAKAAVDDFKAVETKHGVN